VISVFVFIATEFLWVGVFALVVFGYAMTSSGVGTMTMIQVKVDNRVRGRVLSFNGLINRGVPALGGVAMGWVADRAGLYWPLAAGAGLCFVVFLIAMRWERRSRDSS